MQNDSADVREFAPGSVWLKGEYPQVMKTTPAFLTSGEDLVSCLDMLHAIGRTMSDELNAFFFPPLF